MTGHRSVRRYGDEYHCSSCGKQWSIDDNEPPPCQRESRATREAVESMRKLFRKDSLQGKQ